MRVEEFVMLENEIKENEVMEDVTRKYNVSLMEMLRNGNNKDIRVDPNYPSLMRFAMLDVIGTDLEILILSNINKALSEIDFDKYNTYVDVSGTDFIDFETFKDTNLAKDIIKNKDYYMYKTFIDSYEDTFKGNMDYALAVMTVDELIDIGYNWDVSNMKVEDSVKQNFSNYIVSREYFIKGYDKSIHDIDVDKYKSEIKEWSDKLTL